MALAALRRKVANDKRRTLSVRLAYLRGIDRAALEICQVLKRRSTRFDGRHFMRIVLG
jgi:hypothetical protein